MTDEGMEQYLSALAWNTATVDLNRYGTSDNEDDERR